MKRALLFSSQILFLAASIRAFPVYSKAEAAVDVPAQTSAPLPNPSELKSPQTSANSPSSTTTPAVTTTSAPATSTSTGSTVVNPPVPSATSTATQANPEPSAAADPIAGSTPAPIAPDLSLNTTGGTELTLEKSIQLGIDGASSVLKAQNDVHYTGSHLLEAYGQFLPSLTGTASYNGVGGRTYYATTVPTYVDGVNRNGAYALVADLNIFNGLSDFSNLRSSLLRKDASDVTVTYAKQQITLDISQAFLQVILDEKLVNIARKNLQASQERERLLQEQTEVGVKNLSDLFRQQAQTASDESSSLSAENKSRTDQIILFRKLRLDLTGKYHFIEPALPEVRSADSQKKEEALIEEGLSKRLDLKAASERADASHWDVHAAIGNYFPKIDFLGQISSVGHYLDTQNVNGVNAVPPNQTDMGTQLGKQIQYTVGITLTWYIFDRFLTAQNVGQTRALADNADVDAQDKKLEVEGEIRQSFGDYQTAIEQLRASKKGLEAAQKAYEVMNGRYTVGAASFLDLITSQTVLVQAESNRAQALINFQLQDKSLAFALGSLNVK